MIWIADYGLTLSNLTSGFTAKNIVLAGVKVCTLIKYRYIMFKCVCILRVGLPISYCICVHVCVQAVTLHDTKQCETWDLGSNFFIRKEDVLSQRRRWNFRLNSRSEISFTQTFPVIHTHAVCKPFSFTFLPQGGSSVPSSRRVEPLCPCRHVFLCSGRQHRSQLSQKISGKVLLFRIWVVATPMGNGKFWMSSSHSLSKLLVLQSSWWLEICVVGKYENTQHSCRLIRWPQSL